MRLKYTHMRQAYPSLTPENPTKPARKQATVAAQYGTQPGGNGQNR